MVAAVSRAILDGLEAMPNRERRTKIGFITVDSSVHFYNLNVALSHARVPLISASPLTRPWGNCCPRARSQRQPTLSQPQMLVVPDLEDIFLPQPDDLLSNLSESMQVVTTLLEKLPDMFKSTQISQSALGAALGAAHQLTVRFARTES